MKNITSKNKTVMCTLAHSARNYRHIKDVVSISSNSSGGYTFWLSTLMYRVDTMDPYVKVVLIIQPTMVPRARKTIKLNVKD